MQYAFALFCLFKLAYLDVSKKEYALWNLFILLVFFVGGIAFLIYYFKVKDVKRIPPYNPAETGKDEPVSDNAGEQPGEPENEQLDEVEKEQSTRDETFDGEQ